MYDSMLTQAEIQATVEDVNMAVKKEAADARSEWRSVSFVYMCCVIMIDYVVCACCVIVCVVCVCVVL